MNRVCNTMRGVLGISLVALLAGSSAAVAEEYFCEFALFAVEPGYEVVALDDFAAQDAAANAAGNPGLFVYPVTQGNISIGDSLLNMQGASLVWSGSGTGIYELGRPSLGLVENESGSIAFGEPPVAEHQCTGPEFTPVFDETLGISAEVLVNPAARANLVHFEATVRYYVPGFEQPDNAEEHRFKLKNTSPINAWTATVKRMPDGGHMLLLARVSVI